MKILHTMAGGATGGAETAFVDIVIAQYEAGMDVSAACRPNKSRNKRLHDAGVPVYEMPFGGLFDFKTKRQLKTIIQDNNIDVVQCWMSRAAKLTPSVAGCQKIARLGAYYNLKYYRDVDHFIGITPDLCRWLIDEHQVDPSHVTTIGNFAEMERVDVPILKTDLDTKNHEFAFLFLGRLHHVKGPDIALRAFAQTSKSVLWMAGDGPMCDELQKLSIELGIENRVRWLGWRDDRAALLNSCDAVIFPSRSEGFGTTFVQAWMAKKPIITTKTQGPSQYIMNESNGLISDINDVDGIANNMDKLMSDQSLYKNLVNNGYKAYQEQFTKSRIIQLYQDLYKSILKTGNS